MVPWLLRETSLGITFRAALAGIAAFVACLMLGPRVIAWLRARKAEEDVEKGDSRILDAMMADKKGTPTMGGIFIVAAILVSLLLFSDLSNPVIQALLFVLVAFLAVGAADDYLKLTGRAREKKAARGELPGRVVQFFAGRSKGGMRMFPKLVLQLLVGTAAGAFLLLALLRQNPLAATKLYFFFGGQMELGVFYPLFVMFVVVATTNAVNITDGLDGLAGGCMAISSFAYAVIAYVVGRVDFSAYLGVPHLFLSGEVTVFFAAVLGATLGFLWFNTHPAQVFMGDSGSLPLGGTLGLAACATKQEMLLVFVGGVFVVEVLSSFLQIFSFKLTGRRIFLIAPLHHHYQRRGIPESKITARFWIVAAVMAVASLAMLRLG